MIVMDKKGSLLLPLAVIILLLVTSAIYGSNHFVKDRLESQKMNKYSYIAQNESENALIYGIFLSNTPVEDGGNKCSSDWYSTSGKHELLNEEKLPSNVSGYKIKHFVSFSGTTDWSDALITGSAEVYDNSGKLLSSKATSIRANMLYKGNAKNATNPCDSITIKINHNSWRHIR